MVDTIDIYQQQMRFSDSWQNLIIKSLLLVSEFYYYNPLVLYNFRLEHHGLPN